MKIGILGNGAIGNLLALKCHKLDQPFSLITRELCPFTLTALDINKHQYAIKPQLVSYAEVNQFELLILPVKAHQVLPALSQMANYVTNQQTLLLLHNGMGILDDAQALLPHTPVIAATTSHAAFKSSGNRVQETGIGVTHCGYVNQAQANRQPALKAILNLLLAPCTWHENITAALWQKLAVNAVINPLTALHRIKNGQLAQPHFKGVIADICREIAFVMQAAGYSTSSIQLIRAVELVITSSKDNYSSMFQDIFYTRKTEIDYINGYIVKQGEKLCIDTPVNARLVKEIHQRETGCPV